MAKRKTVNFKSKKAYRDWLAWKHMHIGASKKPFSVKIRGKAHKVVHTKKTKKRKKRK